ncbi:hypothetical protein GALL_534380 [mine drainage metagenome]|uniref:Uncharacterized protein n=1 Tax=mine drainage metagenome TaxID=410659 RepID=A0A1J5P1M1_9ZZZZ
MQAAREIMIDGSFRNGLNTDEAGEGHHRQKIEHDGRTKPIGQAAGDRGGGGVACMVEGLVAPDPSRERTMTDQTERYRRNRRRENHPGCVRDSLRDRNRPEAGEPWQQQRRRGDEDRRADHHDTLRFCGVDQRAGRRLRNDARNRRN